MPLRRFIASGLLLAVLLAPAFGLALCNAAASPAASGCARCAEMERHAASIAAHHIPAGQLPVAPCCQRKAPMPAMGESSALVVAPLQIALLPAQSPAATQAVLPVSLVENQLASPPPASSLSLLCTLRI